MSHLSTFDDIRGICLRSIPRIPTIVCYIDIFVRAPLVALFSAMMKHIVGTRAEAPVAEQNHNCSPILSAPLFSNIDRAMGPWTHGPMGPWAHGPMAWISWIRCEDETKFHSADSSALCAVRIERLSCYTI